MKKVLFAAAMVLAFAVSASAAVKEVGPVTVDVPEGCTTQVQGPASIVLAPDQKSVVTVALAPASGATAQTLAENASKGMGGKDLKADGDGWVYAFSHSGAQGLIRVSVQKDQAVICTMIGENPELMEIARSVKLK